eukprot:1750772-Karenia_brevis.AAC.1
MVMVMVMVMVLVMVMVMVLNADDDDDDDSRVAGALFSSRRSSAAPRIFRRAHLITARRGGVESA